MGVCWEREVVKMSAPVRHAGLHFLIGAHTSLPNQSRARSTGSEVGGERSDVAGHTCPDCLCGWLLVYTGSCY